MSVRRRGCRVALGVLALLVLLTCVGVAISVLESPDGGSDTEVESVDTPRPVKRPTARVVVTADGDRIRVGGTAYIDGRDLENRQPYTLMRINAWDQVPRRTASCRVFHGDEVQVLEAWRSVEEDRYYFRVDGPSCEGWVPEPFLGTEFYNLVGDPIY